MTYNVHGCVGSDGVLDIRRIADVVRAQQPDLLMLQEVDVARERSRRVDQADWLAQELGLKAHFTCALQHGEGEYGIAMLASQRLHIEREGCLPARRDEVRAAQWARVELAGFEVDVLHTHLSISLFDRKSQLRTLLGREWLESRLAHPHLVVCGDLNALPWSEVYRSLSRRLRDAQRAAPGRPRATWPARFPLARVDHVFVGRGFDVQRCVVPRNGAARLASDHLPLLVELSLKDTSALAGTRPLRNQ